MKIRMKRVINVCALRGLCVGSTYFKHKSIHKYIRMAIEGDRIEIMSIMDMVVIIKDTLKCTYEVK